MDFGGDRDSGCKQPVWARWIGALGYMWDAWMCEVAPRQRRVRTTDVEVGIVGAGAAGMPAAERARGRAGGRGGWWVRMGDVGPEYSTWTWLSPAGQGTYGWLRISAGPGAGGMACGLRGRDALLPLQCARAGWACCRRGSACCRGVDCTVGGRTRGGRGALGAWGPSRQKPAVRVVIHLTTGIDRVLACAHFPDVTRSRGPCSETRTVGGVGRCIVAPGICARRQMRGRL